MTNSKLIRALRQTRTMMV